MDARNPETAPRSESRVEATTFLGIYVGESAHSVGFLISVVRNGFLCGARKLKPQGKPSYLFCLFVFKRGGGYPNKKQHPYVNPR